MKISDTIVSFGTEAELSKSSYFLWYDRVEPELPSHMKCLLRCVGSSKAFQIASGSILKTKTRHCKDLIECIKNGRDLNLDLRQKLQQKVSKCLNAENLEHINSSVTGLLECIFGKFSSLNDHFKYATEIVVQCRVCGRKSISRETPYAVLNPASFSSEDIARSLGLSSKCIHCNSDENHCSWYISWLPDTMCFTTEKMTKINEIPLDFDLEAFVKPTFPLISTGYELSTLLSIKNGVYRYIFRRKSEFFILDDTSNSLPVQTNISALQNEEILLCCFDKIVKQVSLKCVQQIQNHCSEKSALRIPEENVPPHLLHQFHGVSQTKYSIESSNIQSLCYDAYWFSSDDNGYLELLSKNTNIAVHMVDAGWFSHKVINTVQSIVLKCDILELQSRSVNWFEKSKIFIPINIRDIHWILLSIDIGNKTICYCDSRGNIEQIILFQICRYLAFEYMLRYGEMLNIDHWRYINFCRSPGFPQQQDGTSCGVYVCQMAKAILSDKTIPNQRHLAHYMRMQIAREIITGSIEY